MRKELLIATAVTALMAGTGFAGAQEGNKGHGGPGAAAQHSAAPKAAPHAQAAPRPQAQGAPRGQMGQRSAPTRMGQTERRQPNRSAQSDKNRPQRNAQTERNRPEQNAQEQRNRTERPTGAAQNERNRGNMEERRGTAQGQENNRGTAQTEQGNRGAVSLSSEQRTKIRQTVIAERGAPRVSRADLGGIDLRVGAVIPRDRIHFRLAPLPQTIVEIEPAWEGFLYFLVGDEVVVVDPTTYDVVAVLPA
jgi:hypothetical protein